MLITFTSKAAAKVTMLEQHTKPILDLLHKDSTRGVITAAETDSAIKLLQNHIDQNVAAHKTSDAIQHDVALHHGDQGDDHDHEKIEHVSFSARSRPLLEMLIDANKQKEDILWGV